LTLDEASGAPDSRRWYRGLANRRIGMSDEGAPVADVEASGLMDGEHYVFNLTWGCETVEIDALMVRKGAPATVMRRDV
jgi:hypothetical protein